MDPVPDDDTEPQIPIRTQILFYFQINGQLTWERALGISTFEGAMTSAEFTNVFGKLVEDGSLIEVDRPTIKDSLFYKLSESGHQEALDLGAYDLDEDPLGPEEK